MDQAWLVMAREGLPARCPQIRLRAHRPIPTTPHASYAAGITALPRPHPLAHVRTFQAKAPPSFIQHTLLLVKFCFLSDSHTRKVFTWHSAHVCYDRRQERVKPSPRPWDVLRTTAPRAALHGHHEDTRPHSCATQVITRDQAIWGTVYESDWIL